MPDFQLYFFSLINEIFIDGIFKVTPKNWYQLLKILGYDKAQIFFIQLAFVILSSKSEEIYNEVYYEILIVVKAYTDLKSFDNVKVLNDL